MLMFWIFIFVDLFTMGIIYAVYGGKRTYSEGMLMGVHMPESAAKSGEVTSLMDQYRRRTKQFYLWNGIVGAAVCLLNFWYICVYHCMEPVAAGDVRGRCHIGLQDAQEAV